MELLESVTNSTRKSSPTRPQHLQLPHGDAHTPTSNPDDILGLDYVPTLPPPPPNSPGTPRNQNETESAARRRNSRTPREGQGSSVALDGSLKPEGDLYDSGSKLGKLGPKVGQPRKDSFGLLTNKAGAGAGADSKEGESRLDFTICMLSTMASVAGGLRSIIAGVALLWLFGRIFMTTTIALHAVLDCIACRLLLHKGKVFKRWSVPLLAFHSVVDMAVNYLYVLSCQVVFVGFLVEPDGTTCDDWVGLYRTLETLTGVCWFVICCRFAVFVLTSMYMLLNSGKIKSCRRQANKKRINAALEEFCHDGKDMGKHVKPLKAVWTLSSILAVSWALASIIGCVRYIFLVNPPNGSGGDIRSCDPLDDSACVLPFPSNFYLNEDASTDTGFRVQIDGFSLPITKSGEFVDPSVINELDGFSTIAPILFYLEGLREGGGKGVDEGSGLPTADTLEDSLTSKSTTLLIDVDAMELVPHFSRLSLEKQEKPILTIQAASPLKHSNHYAVALVNAADADGALLPRSPGLVKLVEENDDSSSLPRSDLFKNTLLPALYSAAPWITPADTLPDNIQMLFDFSTISENSQLGKLRKVRDTTVSMLNSPTFEWTDGPEGNLKTNKIVNHDCSVPGNFIARTVHLQLSIPWFLEKYGSGHRGATLDSAKVLTGVTEETGNLKFIVEIPCSLEAAATSSFSGRELSSVVQYGHGLFYSREELISDTKFLHRMADENGYLLIAADWRGMSMFDLPIIARVLLADPSLFQATLDNLIQGYASMLCMLHYTQTSMLTELPSFLHFNGQPVPVDPDFEVTFYGISQGGILGGGYNALMGSTNLLKRSVLGVPGTPFALIMGKSADFEVFNNIMLLNFYSERDIRIMLSLIQMAWDTVEAGGLLAPPVAETPPPVLIQAGLGDAEVPTMAAEILARSYGAKTLPGNPRDVYGIPRVGAAAGSQVGPRCAYTEVLYEKEYGELPEGDETPDFNNVHFCVRLDSALQEQIVEFINEGVIVDPCEIDSCIRTKAWCL